MTVSLETVVKTLQDRFGAQVSESRGEASLLPPPEHIVAACLALRDKYGFELLFLTFKPR